MRRSVARLARWPCPALAGPPGSKVLPDVIDRRAVNRCPWPPCRRRAARSLRRREEAVPPIRVDAPNNRSLSRLDQPEIRVPQIAAPLDSHRGWERQTREVPQGDPRTADGRSRSGWGAHPADAGSKTHGVGDAIGRVATSRGIGPRAGYVRAIAAAIAGIAVSFAAGGIELRALGATVGTVRPVPVRRGLAGARVPAVAAVVDRYGSTNAVGTAGRPTIAICGRPDRGARA